MKAVVDFDSIIATREGFYAAIGQVEYDLVKRALELSHGLVSEAARSLKMKRVTLVSRIRRYGLKDYVDKLRKERPKS